MRRDNHRCVLCGAPANQVDHIIERARGGGDDPGNLRSLCQPCHRIATARYAGERSGAERGR